MISTAIFKLSSSNIKDTLSCAFRYKMYKAKKILTGISKAHASSCTGFVVGSRAGKVESYHTLVLVPDICHTVYMGILAVYKKAGEQIFPVMVQILECFLHLCGSMIFFLHGKSCGLADHIWCFPFFFLRIFTIPKKEYQFFLFPWGKYKINLVTGDGIPSTGNRTSTFSLLYGQRPVISTAHSQKFIPAGVKTVNGRIYRKEAVVISSLPVFCFVVNSASLDLHFSNT